MMPRVGVKGTTIRTFYRITKHFAIPSFRWNLEVYAADRVEELIECFFLCKIAVEAKDDRDLNRQQVTDILEGWSTDSNSDAIP